MTRNHVLAFAAVIGVVSASLSLAAQSIALSDQWGFGILELKLANVFAVGSEAFGLLAFGFAAVGLLSAARTARLGLLAAAAGLFTVYGIAGAVSAILRLVAFSGEPWKFTAAEVASAAASFAIAIAGGIAARAFMAARDARLGGAAGVLAIAYGLFALSFGFLLAGYLGVSFFSSGRVSWGLGLIAGGHLIAGVGAAVAALGLAAGLAWGAGQFGAGAFVFAGGLVVASVGFMVLATEGGGASGWINAFSFFVLAAAAAVAGVAIFFLPGASEQSDGPDLPVLPDPA